MIGCIGALLNCLCCETSDERDFIEPRLANEIQRVNELAHKREMPYFNQLKKVVDEYRYLYVPPELDSLGLSKNAKNDFVLLQEITSTIRSLYVDKTKLAASCKRALVFKFPESFLQQVVGDKIDISSLDPERKVKKIEKIVNSAGHDCPVCLDVITSAQLLGEAILFAPCGNAYHKSCLEQAFKAKKECPDCRVSFELLLADKVQRRFIEENRVEIEDRLKKKPQKAPAPSIQASKQISDEEFALQIQNEQWREVREREEQIRADNEIANSLADLDS